MSDHPVKSRKKLIEVAIPLEAQRLGLEAYASDRDPAEVCGDAAAESRGP